MAVTHFDETTGRGPSPAIWGNFTRDQVDFNEGSRVKTDFVGMSGTVTSNKGSYATDGCGFTTYEGSGATTKQISTINSIVTSGGIIEALAATDNADCSGEIGDGNAGLVTPTSASGGIVAFETRILIDVTTANITSFAADYFIGLITAGKGSGAAGVFTTADALVSTNYMIGAWLLTGAPTTLKCGWQNATSLTTKGTLQAGITGFTWYKIGFLFTPSGLNNVTTGDMLQWFVNGVEVGAMRSSGASTIDANFPTGLNLLPGWSVMPNGSHSNKLDIDWIQCYQQPQTNG